MQAIKDGAGGLKSSGATRADYGLELAERYITVHSDRRQIVIFFYRRRPVELQQL